MSLLGIAFMICSGAVRAGAAHGLMLCASVVIPSLFAFLCLCEWISLSGSAAVLTRLLRPLLRWLMGPAWQGGMALLLCLLGGYPMGATALARLKEQGSITQQQTKGLSLWIFCPSPAFVITGVGQGMIGSLQAGLLLWSSCVLSVLLTGGVVCRVLRRFREPAVARPTEERTFPHGAQAFVEAVAAASYKMLLICGTVVLFGGIRGLLDRLPLPAAAKVWVAAMGEVTTGCAVGSGAGLSLPLLGAVISFGGICTHMQCKAILGDLLPRYDSYLLMRLLQSGLTFLLLSLLCHCFPDAVPVMSSGVTPVGRAVSLLPSAALLLTCVVFLSSLNLGLEKRRKNHEESGIYS